MAKTPPTHDVPGVSIIDGFEWGISYGVPDGSGQTYPSKWVTTDVGGPLGFSLAAQAAVAMDSSKPVLAVVFKGPKKLAILTLVKPVPAASPASSADPVEVVAPHARALSL